MTSDSLSPQSRPRRALDSGTWPAPIAEEPVHAVVHVPGSKSETNRALVLAALANGPSIIRGGLDARDTRLMKDGLRALGVSVEDDRADWWRITPPARLAVAEAEIDCGLAGTVMRFLPPIAALNDGTVRFTGDEQAETRPVGPLLDALYDIGAGVPPDVTTLPFAITGNPDLPGGPVQIDASASSQFVSGLLLAGARYARGIDVRHVGPSLPSRPHIDMTVNMLRARGVTVRNTADQWVVEPGPIQAADITIEPDLSNAAPFLAAAAITGGTVTIPGWPTATNQPGDAVRSILLEFGAQVDLTNFGLTVTGNNQLQGVDLDLGHASELTPVVVALAAVANGTSRLSGIAHIRGHETDRLAALEAELNSLGAHVRQTHDGLIISPRVLHGGDFKTYADHRMAHAGAVLGLLVEHVVLDDIGCTAKTLPEFPDLWTQMLADSDAWSARGNQGSGPGATS